jgi:hypothetical protein
LIANWLKGTNPLIAIAEVVRLSGSIPHVVEPAVLLALAVL